MAHSAFSSKAALTALFCYLTTSVNGHSWVEQLTLIAPNGTFVGEPGFPRGNVLRTDPGFSDTAMVNLLPPNGGKVLPTDKMCRESQQSQTQSDGSPRLQAGPGDAVALRFQENGHVSLPETQPGKPDNRGYIYVYGTTDPKPDDTFLSIHKVWNADGTGGDKRGVLLSTQNYDDGRCYQVNGGEISTQRQAEFAHEADPLMGGDLWCQQDIALPKDAPSGKPYTLYWVWDWPTQAGVDPGLPDGKEEIYTTCMDIDIVADVGAQKVATGGEKYIDDQSLNNAAIPSQMAQLREPAAVPGGSENAPKGGDSTATEAATQPTATSNEAGQATVTETVTVTASSPPERITEKVTVTQTVDAPISSTTEPYKLPIIGVPEQSTTDTFEPTTTQKAPIATPGGPGAIPEGPAPGPAKPTFTPETPTPPSELPPKGPQGSAPTPVDPVPTPDTTLTTTTTSTSETPALVIIPITETPADPSPTPSAPQIVTFSRAVNGRFRITTQAVQVEPEQTPSPSTTVYQVSSTPTISTRPSFYRRSASTS
ncbi:hypothetical protein FQN54_004911 [Arachnomyces sp. PD_36]|nr:hypothetical protein FQN54_004911 [Arachnomyces sp. PD_36]